MEHDEQIIKTLMSNDVYKAYMARFAHTNRDDYWNRNVRYRLTNRTKSVQLAKAISMDELNEQMDAIRGLVFTKDDLDFISTINPTMRDPVFLSALRDVRMPRFQIGVTKDLQLDITVTGKWGDAIWWEIPLLALVNELYTRQAIGRDLPMALARGVSRMNNKINLLARHPDIKFLWFGTRRAASREWEKLCFETWLQALPEQMTFCSNMQLSREYGVRPGGTQAHEAPMILAAIRGMESDEMLFQSQNRFFDEWWSLFGGPVSIALSDTFGSDHFFNTFGEDRAVHWWGSRQDSGSPFDWGERYISMLKQYGVNPVGKMALFSDGLDPWLMVKLNDHFRGRVDRGFGIGTNLTADLGVKNLSLVMKVEAVEGEDGWVSAVKLSDNPAKAIGDPAEVERYKRVFGVTDGEYVEPRY